jgi:hypothetical protein
MNTDQQQIGRDGRKRKGSVKYQDENEEGFDSLEKEALV